MFRRLVGFWFWWRFCFAFEGVRVWGWFGGGSGCLQGPGWAWSWIRCCVCWLGSAYCLVGGLWGFLFWLFGGCIGAGLIMGGLVFIGFYVYMVCWWVFVVLSLVVCFIGR